MTTRRGWLRAAPVALALLAPVARATEPPAEVRAAPCSRRCPPSASRPLP